jgi:hypothetical protein
MQFTPDPTGRRRFLAGGLAGVAVGVLPGAAAVPAAAASPMVHDVVAHGALSEAMRAAPAHAALTDEEVGERNVAAIRAAMALIEAAGGGTLFVPAGTFLVRPYQGTGAVIEPVDNTTVLFEPGARLQVVLGGGRTYYMIRPRRCVGSDCIDLPVQNVSILGAHLIGVKDPLVQHGYGIMITSARNLRIRDCHVIGMEDDGAYLRSGPLGEPCRDVVVQSCVFDGNGRQGLTLSGVRNITISGCMFRATGGNDQGSWSGLVLEPSYRPLGENRDVRVISNLFVDNERVGMLLSQKHPNEAVVAVGNWFIANGSWAASLAAIGPRDGTSPEIGRGPGSVFYGNLLTANNRDRSSLTDGSGAIRVASPDAVVVANTANQDFDYELWLHHQFAVQTVEGIDGAGVLGDVRGCVVVDNRLVSNDQGALGHHAESDLGSHLIAENVLTEPR